MDKRAGLAAVAAIVLAGCGATQTTQSPQAGNPLVGPVTGEVIGSQVAEVPDEPGAIVGSIFGEDIGVTLDSSDRKMAEAAEYRALEYGRTGRPVVWRNERTGRYGEVVVGSGYSINSLDCREYRHTVYVDGRPRLAEGTACRQSDSTWRVQS